MKHSQPNNEHGIPEGTQDGSRIAIRTRSFDRKAMQLCSQVRYALEYAINSALNGDFGVTVLEVIPAPNTLHLLVFVQSLEDLTLEESSQLQVELTEHIHALRSAVSESIHRRKTPGLSFQVVPRTL